MPFPIYREAVRRVDLNGERQVDVAAELGLGISAPRGPECPARGR